MPVILTFFNTRDPGPD